MLTTPILRHIPELKNKHKEVIKENNLEYGEYFSLLFKYIYYFGNESGKFQCSRTTAMEMVSKNMESFRTDKIGVFSLFFSTVEKKGYEYLFEKSKTWKNPK